MNDLTAPFGTYSLPRIPRFFLKLAQSMPVTWMGRRLALWSRRAALSTLRGHIVDASVVGLHYRLYVNDNISERKYLFMPQFCDRAERALLWGVLKPGDTFVDIGANAGVYSIPAAHAVGPTGRVLSIEPNPAVRDRLGFNARINDLKNISLDGRGVSDAVGTFSLMLDDTNLGGSSLVAGRGGGVMTIHCAPLLDILLDHQINHIRALKIDIEGAEDRALIPFLHGANEDLLPDLMIIENSAQTWAGDVIGALATRGYVQVLKTRMNLVFNRPGAA